MFSFVSCRLALSVLHVRRTGWRFSLSLCISSDTKLYLPTPISVLLNSNSFSSLPAEEMPSLRECAVTTWATQLSTGPHTKIRLLVYVRSACENENNISTAVISVSLFSCLSATIKTDRHVFHTKLKRQTERLRLIVYKCRKILTMQRLKKKKHTHREIRKNGYFI